jgi:pilus assembly protein CpaB
MNTRRIIPALLIAIAVSIVFTFWFTRQSKKSEARVRPGLHYLVIARDVEANETLTASDVKLVDWPGSSPLTGGFTRIEDATGRTVLYPLASGEPLNERQLAAAGSGAGLSSKVPPGMRALSLKSDQVVGVAGFLFPGTRVDVLVTYTSPSSSTPITSTVLQDAEILTAGEKMEPDPKGQPATVDVVTLLVSPEDAQKAVLASTQGSVHFVLRNGADSAHVDTQPAQLASLGQVGEVKPPVSPRFEKVRVVPAAPVKYTVELMNGDKATRETF